MPEIFKRKHTNSDSDRLSLNASADGDRRPSLKWTSFALLTAVFGDTVFTLNYGDDFALASDEFEKARDERNAAYAKYFETALKQGTTDPQKLMKLRSDLIEPAQNRVNQAARSNLQNLGSEIIVPENSGATTSAPSSSGASAFQKTTADEVSRRAEASRKKQESIEGAGSQSSKDKLLAAGKVSDPSEDDQAEGVESFFQDDRVSGSSSGRKKEGSAESSRKGILGESTGDAGTLEGSPTEGSTANGPLYGTQKKKTKSESKSDHPTETPKVDSNGIPTEVSF